MIEFAGMSVLRVPRRDASLGLLRILNTARLRRARWLSKRQRTACPPGASVEEIRRLEAALEQNDADGRERVNARQLALFGLRPETLEVHGHPSGVAAKSCP